MSSLRRNIFIRCATDPALAALIDTRCYPIRLPDDVTLPAITYKQISDDDFDFRAHGEGTERTIARVTVDCWGETSDETADVADALIAAWTGYQLPPDIGWAQIVLRQDNFESALGRFRTIVDIRIEHAR